MIKIQPKAPWNKMFVYENFYFLRLFKKFGWSRDENAKIMFINVDNDNIEPGSNRWMCISVLCDKRKPYYSLYILVQIEWNVTSKT